MMHETNTSSTSPCCNICSTSLCMTHKTHRRVLATNTQLVSPATAGGLRTARGGGIHGEHCAGAVAVEAHAAEEALQIEEEGQDCGRAPAQAPRINTSEE